MNNRQRRSAAPAVRRPKPGKARKACNPLDGIAHQAGSVLYEGRSVPLLYPIGEYPADVLDFDRAVCASGIKAYFRPVNRRELPSEIQAQWVGLWVYVEELARGIRRRKECDLFVPDLDPQRN